MTTSAPAASASSTSARRARSRRSSARGGERREVERARARASGRPAAGLEAQRRAQRRPRREPGERERARARDRRVRGSTARDDAATASAEERPGADRRRSAAPPRRTRRSRRRARPERGPASPAVSAARGGGAVASAGRVASRPRARGPGATPSSRSRWARWPSSSPSLQRPGLEVAETKVDLHVAPGSFLRDVLSAWTPTRIAGPRLRRPVRRLPVADGAVLRARRPRSACPTGSSGGCGSARRWRSARGGWCACSTRSPGARAAPATWPAALLYMLNPYVVTYVGRTSITLLADGGAAVAAAVRAPRAARPARLVVAGGLRARADLDRRRRQRRRHRAGCCSARRCWWSTSWAGARVAPGAARAFVVRLVPVAALACAVVGRRRARPRALRPGLPALHRAAGDDLEHDLAARVAAAAGLLDELHRRRLHGHAARLPGRRRRLPGARAGRAGDAGHPRAVPGRRSRWTRRARYAPFFLALVAPRPAGDVRRLPRGRAAAPRGDLHLQPRAGRALPAHDATRRGRSSSLGLAGLGALGRARAAPAPARRGARRRGGAGGGRVLAAGARRSAWIASSGCPTACPAAWRDAAHDLDRTLPPGQRAMVLPGQLFAFYDWGGTYDPILPALTDRPVATRFIVPFADLRAVDLQWTTDALVSQQRAAARPAAAAARPHGRRRRRAGRRRRPLAQRRRARPPRRRGSCARSGRPPAPTARRGRVPGAAGTLEPAARLPQVRRWSVPHRRHGARAAARRARRWSTARRRRSPTSPPSARCAPTARCTTPPTSTRPRCAPQAGARGVVRHQRLQPPARLRRRAPARQHGLDRARRREALRGRRAARPVPAPRDRRADRRARRRRGGLGPRRLLARLRPVPRAPAVRRARRRPGDRVAGRPRAGHRSPPPRRELHGAARRRPRRPHALQRRPGPRGPRGGQRARVRRARRVEPAARSACAACAR